MRRVINKIVITAVALFITGISQASIITYENYESSILRGKDNRHLILHGYNTSNKAKVQTPADSGLPLITEEDAIRVIQKNGNNSVRLLIAWAKIMPERGVINHDYLNEVETRVNWFTDQGAQVILDMHQDVWGGGLTNVANSNVSNGAPAWANEIGNVPMPDPDKHYALWVLAYLEPAVGEAFKSLYHNKNNLSDYYADTWVAVAERFGNNQNVLGYDLINEPYGGNECLVFVTACTRVHLTPFYQKLISRIRAVDQKSWIVFEPFAVPYAAVGSFGGAGGFENLKDELPDGKQRLLFSPHFYSITSEVTGVFTPLIALTELKLWKMTTLKVMSANKVPVYVGEFGFDENLKRPWDVFGLGWLADLFGIPSGSDQYMNALNNVFEPNLMSWAWWADDHWSPENERKLLTQNGMRLKRAYPKATAGTLLSYSYNKQKCEFNMVFNPELQADGWTEIFLPSECFLNLRKINVTNNMYGPFFSASADTIYDEITSTLKLRVIDTSRIHRVSVSRR